MAVLEEEGKSWLSYRAVLNKNSGYKQTLPIGLEVEMRMFLIIG